MSRRKLPADHIVLQLARSGVQPKEIARRYGGGNVLGILRRYPGGYELIRRLDSQRKKTPLRWKGAELRRLIDTYQRCGGVGRTARELGTSRRVVRLALRSAGVLILSQSAAQSGRKNPSWRGGVSHDRAGRVLLYRPEHPFATRGGYVRRSRLVMEKHIGRYLRPGEVVHHRDGDPTNDRLKNLQLFRSNAEHLRVTLAGKCPRWSEDGKRRIREGASRSARRRFRGPGGSFRRRTGGGEG